MIKINRYISICRREWYGYKVMGAGRLQGLFSGYRIRGVVKIEDFFFDIFNFKFGGGGRYKNVG